MLAASSDTPIKRWPCLQLPRLAAGRFSYSQRGTAAQRVRAADSLELKTTEASRKADVPSSKPMDRPHDRLVPHRESGSRNAIARLRFHSDVISCGIDWLVDAAGYTFRLLHKRPRCTT
jgi:hypothetical protein